MRTTFSIRSGFTLVELLVFAAVFTLASIGLIATLVTFTASRVRSEGQAEVNQQSLAVLQTIQAYVEQSSLIEMDSAATTTLKLRMASSSIDPTYIKLSGNTIYLQQTDAGELQPLTSDRVVVSNLDFVKQTNAPGHDSVRVAFTMTYNAGSALQRYTQGVATGISRVNAATFDSSVVPGSNAAYKLGVSTSTWQSINDRIYFSGSNVGIGVSNPSQVLEVNGGLRLNTATAKPTCTVSLRGTFWVVQNSSGTPDNVQVCVQSTTTYEWAVIF